MSGSVRLPIGTEIGPYRIECSLGEGGMGVVFKALDTKLNRPVAIKLLSDQLADTTARGRFQREAQTASALNHPHILTVYDTGEFEGRQFLVTEFVDGGTLTTWLKQGRTWRQIIELLTGVADGLAAAHDAKILHRDIKPDNILVAKNGYAKLGDFGIAKLVDMTTSLTSTVTLPQTSPGVIMGTIAYMSPEQALGREVDARSDIFSFGTVLYESLTGRRPFQGASDLQVLQAVLHEEPASLSTKIPAALHAVVEKALEKDPADRYQTARELVVDMRRGVRSRVQPAGRIMTPTARWVAATAIVTLLLGGAVDRWFLESADSSWRNPLDGATFTRLTDFEGVESDAAISRDGNLVAFISDRAGTRDVWVLQLGSGQFVNLTEGKSRLAPTQSLSFTPDGSQVTFSTVRVDASGKQIISTSIVPSIGGPVRLFLDGRLWPIWSPDASRLLFFSLVGDKDVVYTAEPDGANAREVFPVVPGEHNHYVTWAANGREIYTARATENLQEFDIWQATVGGTPVRLTSHNAYVSYPTALDDHTMLYVAADENGAGTWLYALDLKRREGHRVSVGIEQYSSIAASAILAGRHRRLVATVSSPTGALWSVPITPAPSTEASVTPFSVPSSEVSSPRFGPDYLLYLSSRDLADGLWKLQDGSASELWKATEGAVLAAPGVSADGGHIAIAVMKLGRPRLYVLTADGANREPLAPSLRVREEPSWAPDGKSLAVVGEDERGPGLFLVPIDGSSPMRLTHQRCRFPQWSPDGRYIAFAEYFQGPQMHLKAVTPDGHPKPVPEIRFNVTQLPKNLTPYRFMADGRSLVLQDGGWRTQQFFSVNITTGERRQLTELNTGRAIRSFDLSPDGKRILFDRVQENSDIVLIDLAK